MPSTYSFTKLYCMYPLFLLIKGFVEIRDAVKRPLFGTAMVEGNAKIPPLPTAIYDDDIDGSMKKGYEIMKPLEERDPNEIIEEAA